MSASVCSTESCRWAAISARSCERMRSARSADRERTSRKIHGAKITASTTTTTTTASTTSRAALSESVACRNTSPAAITSAMPRPTRETTAAPWPSARRSSAASGSTVSAAASTEVLSRRLAPQQRAAARDQYQRPYDRIGEPDVRARAGRGGRRAAAAQLRARPRRTRARRAKPRLSTAPVASPARHHEPAERVEEQPGTSGRRGRDEHDPHDERVEVEAVGDARAHTGDARGAPDRGGARAWRSWCRPRWPFRPASSQGSRRVLRSQPRLLRPAASRIAPRAAHTIGPTAANRRSRRPAGRAAAPFRSRPARGRPLGRVRPVSLRAMRSPLSPVSCAGAVARIEGLVVPCTEPRRSPYGPGSVCRTCSLPTPTSPWTTTHRRVARRRARRVSSQSTSTPPLSWSKICTAPTPTSAWLATHTFSGTTTTPSPTPTSSVTSVGRRAGARRAGRGRDCPCRARSGRGLSPRMRAGTRVRRCRRRGRCPPLRRTRPVWRARARGGSATACRP